VTEQPEITAILGGKRFARSDVIEREIGRARHALSKWDAPRPVSGGVESLREAVTRRKAELGRSGIESALDREVRWSTRVARVTAVASRGRRATSAIELLVSRGSAASFVKWFNKCTETNNEPAMLAAHPEHYIISTRADGRQEVWETNGGSPLAARFFIDYEDTSSLRTAPSPEYPVQVSGSSCGRGPPGRRIGNRRRTAPVPR
jgi:hypothetical protein